MVVIEELSTRVSYGMLKNGRQYFFAVTRYVRTGVILVETDEEYTSLNSSYSPGYWERYSATDMNDHDLVMKALAEVCAVEDFDKALLTDQ